MILIIMSGCLYLVGTPIGNLEDITHRAVRILSESDAIYCEDTRCASQLLRHLGLKKDLVSCHDHNEARRSEEIVNRCLQGQKISLISDAGSPCIADPGYRVVSLARLKKVRIEVIPGPCAVISALSLSGLPTHAFRFMGFLPVKSAAREKRLKDWGTANETLIVYESPYRIHKTLECMAQLFPDRRVVVAREMTKKFEEVRSGLARDWKSWLGEGKPRGEYVLMLEGLSRHLIDENDES